MFLTDSIFAAKLLDDMITYMEVNMWPKPRWNQEFRPITVCVVRRSR